MQKKGKRILNNKQIVSFLIGLMTILILIMGSSYAYFSVEINKNSSNTIITATTEQVATASLSQGVEKLKLNLSLNNMKQSNVGNYYADDENDYAPNKSLGYHDFATLTLSNSGKDDNIYRCSMNVNIESNISDIQKGDMKVHFIIGNQVYDIDLTELVNNSYKQEIETELVGNSDKTLRGYIELSNKETEQNYLAGKNFNITINTTLNNCELTGKEAVYLVNTNIYYPDSNYYRGENYKDKIKKIEFVDYIASDYQNKIAYWDLTQTSGERKSPAGSIIGWLEDSGDEEVPYNLYIGTLKNNQVIYAINLVRLFLNMENVETIDFNNLNTSISKDFSGVFNGMQNLKEIDISKIDTSKATTISTMFNSARSLKELNLNTFDTSNVENMNSLFRDARNLEKIDISEFNTIKVTTMYRIFYNNLGLKELNLNNFDTSNVINMSDMFYSTNLLTLNMNNFNTSNVTNMNGMFINLTIEQLNISNFTSNSLISVNSMFRGSKIQQIDMRNMDFTNIDISLIPENETVSSNIVHMFYLFNSNATIIVKDEANKKWIEDRLQESGRTGNVIVAN